jgi:transmembrane sensor
MYKQTSSLNGLSEASEAIDRSAAQWVARCDRGNLSEAEQADLTKWASADPRRAGAFARALAIDIAFSNSERGNAIVDHGESPVELPRRRFLAAAASIVALSASGWAGYRMLQGAALETTQKGSIRRVALEDGSTAILNTDSAVSTTFDSRLRKVTLLKGEALFDVAKDKARPFLVEAGGVIVRAVGTSFAVHVPPEGGVSITMREGVIDVLRERDGAAIRAIADTKIYVPGTGKFMVHRVATDEVERTLSWKDGQIDLNNRTVGEAIREFSRYSDRKIVVKGEGIATLRIAGLYPVNDPDGFAQSVAMAFDLVAERTPTGTIIRAAGPQI